MVYFTEVFLIFVMTVILLMYLMNHYGEIEYVKATDNREYLVRNLSDKQQAANLLADITADLTKLVQHMMAKFPSNEDVVRLYGNYNPDAISEGSVESGYTSYSVNKGEKLILCIRQKDQSFVDKNTIMYVAVHELGHLMTKEVGHPDSFWKNFRFLLDEAINIDIYTADNYASKPKDYCGIQINNTIL
jgi:predicted metal-dependent hydrolase